MEAFMKITEGFVVESYALDGTDRFVCVYQKFVPVSEPSFKDLNNRPIDPPDHEPRHSLIAWRVQEEDPGTVTTTETRLRSAIEQVLETLDAGGEQSRQFAEEIQVLTEAIRS